MATFIGFGFLVRPVSNPHLIAILSFSPVVLFKS
jgi:hypothetical protein